MDARHIIADLRDQRGAAPAALAWFARGLADHSVSDAQAGAFAMAVLLNGLDETGRVALTTAMRDSGHVMRWDLPGPVMDKHSTGGVGDCVSLALAPALAACGGYVPMISGRGLGHTGGTLDKLEAIPGYQVDLSDARFQTLVRDLGCAIVAATKDLAPADRRLYAIRDISATVESIDLITASILSKKLAAGLETLVLDVKCGSGAFMKTKAQARDLARALVRTANGAGCKTSALITDMSQPLAPSLGNALEVAEIMALLCEGKGGALRDVTVALGAETLRLAGLAHDDTDGDAQIQTALDSGRAAEIFARMVAAQGGPRDITKTWRADLPKAPVIRAITAPKSGVLTAINGEDLGHAVVALGGGRMVESDAVDPRVGLSDMVELGADLAAGDVLCHVHAADETGADAGERAVLAALDIAEENTNQGSLGPRTELLVLDRVREEGDA